LSENTDANSLARGADPASRNAGPVGPHLAAIDKPVLLILTACGVGAWLIRPEAFIGDDAYFYLVIARNLALNGQHTFSGLCPTNGVHPLWCYLLVGYDALLSRVDLALLWSLKAGIPLTAALLIWGVRNFWRVAEILHVSRMALVGIPLVFLLVNTVLYSEAVAHYTALSLLTLACVDGTVQKRWGPYLVGLMCALVFLARLDSVFFLACYLLCHLWQSKSVMTTLRVAVVFSLLVVPYLVANWVYFGAMVPVSGWMKSSFPSIFLKGLYLDQGPYASMLLGYRIVWGVIPIVCGAATLALMRKGSAQARGLMIVYLLGSVLHFTYVALFVRSHSIWAWYYVVPTILLALTMAIWMPPQRRYQAASAIVLLSAGIVILGKALRPATSQEALWYPQVESTRYVRENGIKHKTILVSDWPGYFAFQTDNRIVAVDMLTANVRLYKEMRRSPNALRFLIDHCAALGRPIEYVIWMGNQWLVPDVELRSVTYNDPRSYPVLVPIGKLDLARPPVHISHGRGFVVWRLERLRGERESSCSVRMTRNPIALAPAAMDVGKMASRTTHTAGAFR